MICPLLKKEVQEYTTGAKPDQFGPALTKVYKHEQYCCWEHECAWWDANLQQCVVHSLRDLALLVKGE